MYRRGVPSWLAFTWALGSLPSTSPPAEPVSREYRGLTAVVEVPTEARPETPKRARSQASAEPRLGRHRWVYDDLFGVRINPLGLANFLNIGYRYQLIDRKGPLFTDSFVAIKLNTLFAPSFGHIGAKLQLQPVSAFGVSVTYGFLGYFGVLSQVLGFPSPLSNYSDSRRRELARMGLNRAALGHTLRVSTLLQARVGPVAVRALVDLLYADIGLAPQDRVFYDQATDLLQPDGGWSVLGDVDVVGFLPKGWALAVRYSFAKSLYRDADFPPEEPNENVPATHRLGPALLYTFFDDPSRRFNRPTIIFLAQWWIVHPWRTGADVHPAVPYAAIALTFEGTLASRESRR